MDLVKALTEKYMKPELPEMNVGDTVRVTVRVKEGNCLLGYPDGDLPEAKPRRSGYVKLIK